MTSPRRASRMLFSASWLCRSIAKFLPRGNGRGVGRQHPLSRVEADVLADAQVAAIGFEQVAHFNSLGRIAQLLPRGVLVGRVDGAAFFVILALDASCPRNVGCRAEVLPRRLLQAINPVVRHRASL